MIITYLTKDSYGVCADTNLAESSAMWKGRILEWQLLLRQPEDIPGGLGQYWDLTRESVPDIVHDVLDLEDIPSWVTDVELQLQLERERPEDARSGAFSQRLYVTRSLESVYERVTHLYFLWEGEAHHHTIEFGSKRELRKVWDKFNAHFDHVFDSMIEQLYLPKEKAVSLHNLMSLKWASLQQQHNLPADAVRLELCRFYKNRIHYAENPAGDLNPKIVTCLAELELWSRKLVACKNVLTYEQYLEWEEGRCT